jgi:hypothetical protein
MLCCAVLTKAHQRTIGSGPFEGLFYWRIYLTLNPSLRPAPNSFFPRANLLLKNPAKPKCRFADISVIRMAYLFR